MQTRAQNLLKKINPRAGPLIMTVFGDAIAPYSADIWLGSLIDLMAPLGLSERLVRTGVYRLTRQKWLDAQQSGRRSYYRITDEGSKAFEDANARIYASSPTKWNGNWTTIQALAFSSPANRKALRDLLNWRGFGQISPTMLIKPQDSACATTLALKEAGLLDKVAVFNARLDAQTDPLTLTENGWDLARFSQSYQNLMTCFKDIENIVDADPETAFIVRTILIHQYRRILLQDPDLPHELLPQHWKGTQARARVAEIYKTLRSSADEFVMQKLQNGAQTYSQPVSTYFKRFN